MTADGPRFQVRTTGTLLQKIKYQNKVKEGPTLKIDGGALFEYLLVCDDCSEENWGFNLAEKLWVFYLFFILNLFVLLGRNLE